MNRYIAFLRGVNISSKNKVPMAQLKTGFEELGLVEVKTYLNSGNVLFSSSRDDTGALAGQIERMITAKFGWDIPVFLILKRELEDILQNAPAWWGTGGKGPSGGPRRPVRPLAEN